jgi:DNA-binding NarL/FixJ family response regulator
MRRRWTPQELSDLARWLRAGLNVHTIAELTKRTSESVRQRRRRLQGKIPKGQ